MTKYIILLLPLLISGCTTLQKVDMSDLPSADREFVTSKIEADNYPGFLTGEGNIYSCRYGIHYMREKEFEPSKSQIFSGLLTKYLPESSGHEVTLNRFDVYYNWRLRALEAAGPAVGAALGGVLGAAIGSEISNSANQKQGTFVFEDLVIELDPENIPVDEDARYVGCKGKHEGDYKVGLVSGGHDVVITWLNFNIGAQKYSYKTYYQTQLDESGGMPQSVEAALEKTFAAISENIVLESNGE